MSNERTLEELYADAEAEAKQASSEWVAAIDAEKLAGERMKEAENRRNELQALLRWSLRIGDIVEWDETGRTKYAGEWSTLHTVSLPDRTVAMQVTWLGHNNLGGLLLKKDGTVGKNTHTIWGGFDPKYHRIRKRAEGE